MIETAGGQHRKAPPKVPDQKPRPLAHAVLRSIPRRKLDHRFVDIDADTLAARHTRKQAEQRDADAGAEIGNALAGFGRNRRREQNGIRTRPMPANRLLDAQPPAEKIVDRRGRASIACRLPAHFEGS